MNNNEKLNNIAIKVLNNTNKDTYHIDPITVIIMISILLTLIRIIQECRKKRTLLNNKEEFGLLLKKDIKDLILKNSWLNNLRLNKILKQYLTKDQYKIYGKKLKDSIMEVGLTLTEDEIYTLMEAAND
jgi:hypothetical protein